MRVRYTLLLNHQNLIILNMLIKQMSFKNLALSL